MSADVQEIVHREIRPVAVMAGSDFPGCSDWAGSADVCTCATWESVECGTCRQVIRDGQEFVDVWVWWDTDVRWDTDSVVLELDSIAHHADCWNERGA